jgi:hypothetical protein
MSTPEPLHILHARKLLPLLEVVEVLDVAARSSETTRKSARRVTP